MKPLYWDRIQLNTATKTVWDKLDEFQLNTSEFEEIFGKPKTEAKAKAKPVEKKPEKVAKVIDGKKSQNLGIFLRSLKVDIDMVKAALLDCDTSWELDTLTQLVSFKPSPEEDLVMLQEHVKNSDIPLDTPDQFLLDMSQIPNYDKRLDCLIFQKTFTSQCQEVSLKMDYIINCSKFLSENADLRKFLSIILGE